MTEQVEGVAVPAETWIVVADHDRYIVSSEGRVRLRRVNAPILRGSLDKDGYRRVCLDGKTKRVHRLVCEAFHGPAPLGREVAHLDGDATNNTARNLTWATHKENVQHSIVQGTFTDLTLTNRQGWRSPRSRFSEADAAQIKREFAEGHTIRGLARQYACNPSTIYKLVKGKSYAA